MSVQHARTRRSVRQAGKVLAIAFAALTITGSVDVGKVAALTPNQTTMPGVVNHLNTNLNDFWFRTFRANGWAYSAPTYYYWFNGPGLPSSYTGACTSLPLASYCPSNRAFYLDLTTLNKVVAAGDYGGGMVLAHEWAHHIQLIRGHATWAIGSRFFAGLELQADCYAGIYTRYLANAGKLASNDLIEATALLLLIGDAAGTSPYAQGAHGSAAQRVAWFTRGYDTYNLGICDGVYTWLYG